MAAAIEWTPAVISTLRTLWGEGVSTAAIGDRMGISKNAVVGKAHRLSLPARPSPIKGRCDTPKRERVRRIAVQLTTYAPLPPISTPAPVPLAVVPPPSSNPLLQAPEPVSLKGATGNTPRKGERCCWPLGEPGRPGFGFCGAPVVRRRPYCEDHCGTAYLAKTDRRHALAESADVAA